MKKTVLLLSLLLCTAVAASAQFGHGQGHERQRQRHERRQERHHERHHDRHHDRHNGHHQPMEVPCTEEWQGLWNGCHVRLIAGQVNIYNRSNDRITWGDEIMLLPSGYYKVRRGDTWRIYEQDGDWTSLYGDEILVWWNGTYCIRKAGLWRVYDSNGDWLGSVNSWDYIELLWNGCYLYKSAGNYFVADEKGERIFNIWGDEVTLMDNGLFRVKRGSWIHYYDIKGEERR